MATVCLHHNHLKVSDSTMSDNQFQNVPVLHRFDNNETFFIPQNHLVSLFILLMVLLNFVFYLAWSM